MPPADEEAQQHIEATRKNAVEQTRPPSRHKPPGQSLFLEVRETRRQVPSAFCSSRAAGTTGTESCGALPSAIISMDVPDAEVTDLKPQLSRYVSEFACRGPHMRLNLNTGLLSGDFFCIKRQPLLFHTLEEAEEMAQGLGRGSTLWFHPTRFPQNVCLQASPASRDALGKIFALDRRHDNPDRDGELQRQWSSTKSRQGYSVEVKRFLKIT